MGMSGWYAVLYEVSPDGGYIDVINTGVGRYPTWPQAYEEAEAWASAENLPLDPLVNENQQQTNMSDQDVQPKPIPFKRIQDPNEFSDGDIIKCARFKIKKLFSKIRKGGEGERKYEFQDGVAVDGEGTEMAICFSKCTQSASAEGKWVTVRSKKTDHGPQGIKFEINSYEKDGETVRKKLIKITPAAEIEYEGGGGGEATKGGPSSAPQSQGHSPGPARSNVHPKEALRDMIDCHKAVAFLVNENYKDASEEFRQGSINTLFIECAKQGLIFDFAKRYAKSIIPPPPKDPKQWKECFIPKGEFEGKTLADLPDDKLLELFSALDSKGSNTPFAECVYQAARDRDILPKPERPPEDAALDPAPEDDIPF